MIFQEDSTLIAGAVSKRMMENKQGNTLGEFLYKTGNEFANFIGGRNK
jgi:hypothetical protein